MKEIPDLKGKKLVVKCKGCPTIFITHLNGRRYCTNKCRLDFDERERQYLMREFEWLAGTDNWDNIVTRLGFASRDSMERWLYRIGKGAWVSKIREDGMPRVYPRAA